MTTNNEYLKSKECYHVAQERKAAGIFMGTKDIIPELIAHAIKCGLSTTHPHKTFALADLYDSTAPFSSITVRLRMDPITRPRRTDIKGFAFDLAGKLVDDYMGLQGRRRFGNEILVMDASHSDNVELTDQDAKQVGAKNIVLTMTYLQDVSVDIEDAMIVHVEGEDE